MTGRARVAGGMALACLANGCAAAREASIPSRIEAPRLASPAAFRAARLELTRRRGAVGEAPHGYTLESRFVDRRSGRAQSARGAIALRPPEGLRLQLVGPAGKLALDVWLGAAGGGRLASPALGLVERTAPGEHRPGRPTSFLAWWMLRRFEGRLLAVTREQGASGEEERLVVRGAVGETVVVRLWEGGLEATRRTPNDVEHVEHRGGECGTTIYESERAALRVEMRCTGETGVPKAKAFDDPDESPR